MTQEQFKKSLPRSGRHSFSTFGGVFAPTILTILGVILFLRGNFVVGEAGIAYAIVILIIAQFITFATALSISAISSNMELRTGGAYYLISRVLGPHFGAAIGFALYFSVALSIAFYILGFTEALTGSFPILREHYLLTNDAVLVFLFLLVYIGAGWTVKTQYIIMAVLFASIVVFIGGALRFFSWSRIYENMGPGYTTIDTVTGLRYTFWGILAIYFPAVTGINSGLSMSGDLRDSKRSIPKGILFAVTLGFVVYFLQIVVFGGAFHRYELVETPYAIGRNYALFGMDWLVALGVLAATLSSGIASMLGAPRILQALSRDIMVLFLKPFARGSSHSDEPRNAILLTTVIAGGVLYWVGRSAGTSALNVVATISTMFFLFSYGMINLSAFIEAVGANPSFRPTFKYFHWSIALLGGIGCIGVALLISPIASVIAAVTIFLLLVYVRRVKTVKFFADARRGFLYNQIQRSLYRLASMNPDSRNWRPTPIIFSGNPNNRDMMVSFAAWMTAMKGILFIANIMLGDFKEHSGRRTGILKQISTFCKNKNINGFPVTVIAESIEQGVSMLLQTTAIGPLHPNIAVFGWSSQEENISPFFNQLHVASRLSMSLVIVSAKQFSYLVHHQKERIDIWWRGRKNGSMMILLAHLMAEHSEWKDVKIRVLRVIEQKAGAESTHQSLLEMISASRINATPQVIVSSDPFEDIVREYSHDATCIFLGFVLPDGEDEAIEWHKKYNSLTMDTPPIVFVSSAEEKDILY